MRSTYEIREAGPVSTRARDRYTSEDTANRLFCLSLRAVSTKWTAPIFNWHFIKHEFAIHFEGRFNPSLGWIPQQRSMTKIFNSFGQDRLRSIVACEPYLKANLKHFP